MILIITTATAVFTWYMSLSSSTLCVSVIDTRLARPPPPLLYTSKCTCQDDGEKGRCIELMTSGMFPTGRPNSRLRLLLRVLQIGELVLEHADVPAQNPTASSAPMPVEIKTRTPN